MHMESISATLKRMDQHCFELLYYTNVSNLQFKR